MKNLSRIVLVDKPAGISSFGVVARVRRQLSEEAGQRVKVGHTGTLDPFATGLMVLLSGKFTRRAGEFSKLDKVYEATIHLGATSTTGDPEGEINTYPELFSLARSADFRVEKSFSKIQNQISISSSNLDFNQKDFSGKSERSQRKNNSVEPFVLQAPTQQEIKQVLQKFTGKITQTPPIYSAIKVDGERAYKLARAGKTPKIPPRQVEIYSLELLEYTYPKLKIRAHVSSGTYIRTLAEDIGKELKTGAYTAELRRIKIGEYDIKMAEKLPNGVEPLSNSKKPAKLSPI